MKGIHSKANEITKESNTSTNVYVEKQLIDAVANPEEFQDKLNVAKKELGSLEDSVTKSMDNILTGDKSQDIGEAERRELREIKEVVIRVQNAKEIQVIAEEDFTDPAVQKTLGITIEKFNPKDTTLPKGVKERIATLEKEKQTLGAFYDRSTGKIFINENAKEEEIRPALAREWKIKEDLEAGKGKENKEGKQRATVAGEIAYDEVFERMKQENPSPISLSKLSSAQMNPDSEVTADLITPEDRKDKVLLRNTHIYRNLPDSYRTAFGGGEVVSSLIRGGKAYTLVKVGVVLIAIPEPSTSVIGVGLVAYGAAEGAFAISNAIEGSQEVYYGLTNQKEKVAQNPGKISLGEETYLILDNVSASAMPYVSQTGEYAKLRGESVGKNAKGTLEKSHSFNDYKTSDSDSNTRYTPKESEIETHNRVKKMYEGKTNIKITPQDSYREREEATYGEKGSVRPEVTVERNGVVVESYEVKNYNRENYSSMTSSIRKQAIQRSENLPKTTVQKIVIDTRGQKITPDVKEKILNDVIRKSKNIIEKENIIFME